MAVNSTRTPFVRAKRFRTQKRKLLLRFTKQFVENSTTNHHKIQNCKNLPLSLSLIPTPTLPLLVLPAFPLRPLA